MNLGCCRGLSRAVALFGGFLALAGFLAAPGPQAVLAEEAGDLTVVRGHAGLRIHGEENDIGPFHRLLDLELDASVSCARSLPISSKRSPSAT